MGNYYTDHKHIGVGVEGDWIPCTWEAQRTIGSPMPEKVEGAVAWGSCALGIPDGEQLAKRCSGSGSRVSLAEVFAQASMSTFHASHVGHRVKGLCWVDVGPSPRSPGNPQRTPLGAQRLRDPE